MDRVCFHVCGRPIYWYGVLVAAGLWAAYVHYGRLARREGRPADWPSAIVFWAAVGGLIGARLAYVIANWPQFTGNWREIPRIDHGGMIFYGGLAGGALALWAYAVRHGVPWRIFADFVLTGLPLGHAFGRVGCFLNGCCYGVPFPALSGPWFAGRLPVQLFESAGNLALYALLIRLRGRMPFEGALLAAYAAGYGLLRFALEFLRGDPRQQWAGLTTAQWISLALLAAGVAFWMKGRAHRHGPADRTNG